MSKNLIIVFTRNPELGKVKTRLAEKIGAKSALIIYTFLLKHTENTIRNLDCDKAVYYSESITYNDIWNDSMYHKYKQKGDDLGERMFNAFSEGFGNNYHKIMIIGSDLYDLNATIINDAFDNLHKNDLVIGPALDGGYYLLGMKKLIPNVFKNKPWGTSSILQETLSNLKHKSVHLLKELNDIDTYDDLKNNSELKQFI